MNPNSPLQTPPQNLTPVPTPALPNQSEIPSPQLPVPTSLPQPVVLQKKKSKGFLNLFLIILLLVIFLSLGIGSYFLYQNSISTEETEEGPKTPLSENVELSDQKIIENTPSPVTEEKVDYINTLYGFTFEYPSEWTVECLNCNDTPENIDSEWQILRLTSEDFKETSDGEIISGSDLNIFAKASGTEPASAGNGYAFSNLNGIGGLLNLDPGAPYFSFIYTDDTKGYDITLNWREVSASDKAAIEMKKVLSTFARRAN